MPFYYVAFRSPGFPCDEANLFVIADNVETARDLWLEATGHDQSVFVGGYVTAYQLSYHAHPHNAVVPRDKFESIVLR